MSSSNLDRIVEELKALTPEEQERVRDLVDSLLASPPPTLAADEVGLRLLEKGLIRRIPPRIRDADFYRRRKPIVVEGKPASAIIIEERR